MMEYLYFPKDKTEYIPAFLTFLIITIISFMVVKLLIRLSKKEAAKFEELERKLQTTNHCKEEDNRKTK